MGDPIQFMDLRVLYREDQAPAALDCTTPPPLPFNLDASDKAIGGYLGLLALLLLCLSGLGYLLLKGFHLIH